jgi:ComF family protein
MDAETNGQGQPAWQQDGSIRRLRAWLAASAAYAADLLLPPLCVACRAPVDRHGVLCPSCWREMTFIRPPICDRLGTPLPYSETGPTVSTAAQVNPPVYGRARAAVVFSGVARQLVHALKYQDRHEAVGFCAQLMREAGRDLLADADLIVPVPLSRLRLLARRFNQAALLARKVSMLSGVPFAPRALRRTRHTPPQVGQTMERRRENVAGAFAVRSGAVRLLAGRRVVLVDDVITTGATVNACASALLEAGAASVDVLAFALVRNPAESEAP